MQKDRLIKNTILIVLGGFIVKILGFVIKIIYTKLLKEKGVSLITMVFPTYGLLLTITGFALPLAVTKMIANKKSDKKNVILSSLLISFTINTIIVSLSIIFADYFAINILHNENCAKLIKILCISLPFVSITSIIKAFFYGKEKIIPVIVSNISEEIIKLILVVKFLPFFTNISILAGASFYAFICLICEIASFIILFLFAPKKIKINDMFNKINYSYVKDILSISIPTLSGKIIGNISFFLEPIILTNFLLYKNFSIDYISLNYGFYQGYAITILTIPSFFLLAFSNNILPSVSRLYKEKNINQLKKTIKSIIKITLFGSLIFTFILYIFGEDIMSMMFGSTSGLKYLKMLLPFFIFFYLESPLITILQCFNEEKKVLKITLASIISKNVSLMALIILNIGFNSIIISEIISIIVVVSLGFYYLKKSFCYLSR